MLFLFWLLRELFLFQILTFAFPHKFIYLHLWNIFSRFGKCNTCHCEVPFGMWSGTTMAGCQPRLIAAEVLQRLLYIHSHHFPRNQQFAKLVLKLTIGKRVHPTAIPHSSSGKHDEAKSSRFSHITNHNDLFQPQDAHWHGQLTRKQKSMSQNDWKPNKNNQTPYWHNFIMTQVPYDNNWMQPFGNKCWATNFTSILTGNQTSTTCGNLKTFQKGQRNDWWCLNGNLTYYECNYNEYNTNSMGKKQTANKTIFNPWKMIPAATKSTKTNQSGGTASFITEYPLKSRCCIKWWNQATGKGAKTIHRQRILNIIDQLPKVDSTLTLFQFYTMIKMPQNNPAHCYRANSSCHQTQPVCDNIAWANPHQSKSGIPQSTSTWATQHQSRTLQQI